MWTVILGWFIGHIGSYSSVFFLTADLQIPNIRQASNVVMPELHTYKVSTLYESSYLTMMNAFQWWEFSWLNRCRSTWGRALVDQPVAGEAQVVPEQEQSEEDQDNVELRVCGFKKNKQWFLGLTSDMPGDMGPMGLLVCWIFRHHEMNISTLKGFKPIQGMTCWLAQPVQKYKNLVCRGAMWLTTWESQSRVVIFLAYSFWYVSLLVLVLKCFKQSEGNVAQAFALRVWWLFQDYILHLYYNSILSYTIYVRHVYLSRAWASKIALKPILYLYGACGGSDDWLKKSLQTTCSIYWKNRFGPKRRNFALEKLCLAMHLSPLKDPDDEEEKENRGDAAWIAAMF